MGVGWIKEEERDKKKTVSEEGIMEIHSRNEHLRRRSRGQLWPRAPAPQGCAGLRRRRGVHDAPQAHRAGQGRAGLGEVAGRWGQSFQKTR